MLLTGFDAPILKTMYLDRYLTNHNLLQAIARTNRPAAGKVNGEIVDYAGAFRELNRALDYPEEVRENAAFGREKLVNDFMVLLDKTMGIFEEIEKTDSPETLNRCLSLLSKQGGARKEFESKFRRLQDIYESLSPDRRLAEEDVLARYGWLNQFWVAYQRSFNRTDRPDEEIKAKTREILEKNVSEEKIRKEFPVYKVGEEHLEMLRDLGDSARANEIAHVLTEQFEEDRRRNPRFEKLSERFDELLMKWKSGQMTDDVFAGKGEEVEREFIEVKKAPEQKQLTSGEYAVEELLKEEYSSHLDGENSAKKIATTIGQKFRDEIDTSYKGWQKNPLIEKDICQVIIQAIVKDLKQPGLYHAKGFVKQVCEYLIENEVKINE
jgi:type I restriction enzyme R subunit